jgi:hypothetical protein
MHLSIPADKVATQSSDDRLASLLYLSQQLNAKRDLPLLLDLMAREVPRSLGCKRAPFCEIVPLTNFGLRWRSEPSVCALTRIAALRGQWYKRQVRM